MIDLRKAFDTVDFDVLLKKLTAMGVKSTDWFRSYLTGRKQCVQVNDTDSDFLEITCGVPQGSILGPILFLCYINDMSIALSCKLSLYADDSTLIASDTCVENLSRFLSNQLESCSKWLVDNKLSLHVDKCESIIFSSARKAKIRDGFKITCSGVNVRRMFRVKYLGVYLDENLTGNDQATEVIKKTSARLSFLYRSSGLFDTKTRATLCLALVQPIFDYCCSSWFTGIRANLKERLYCLQRKMVRFIFDFDARHSVDSSHLRSLCWLSFKDRVRYFKLILAFKIHNGTAPRYLSDSFSRFSSVHSYDTRRSQTDYVVSRDDTASSVVMNGFTYTAKREWNLLPIGLKTIPKLDVFKRRLRKYFLNCY